MRSLFTVLLFFISCCCVCAQGGGASAGFNISGLVSHHVTLNLVALEKDTTSYFSVEDTLVSVYKLPEQFTLPAKWQIAEQARLKNGFYKQNDFDSITLEQALYALDSSRQFNNLEWAKNWCIVNYKQAFPYLVSRLTMKQKVPVGNLGSANVCDRENSKDTSHHTVCIDEDIYTVAGRASWTLNQLTGENFAVVKRSTSRDEAENMKWQWIEYLEKLRAESARQAQDKMNGR